MRELAGPGVSVGLDEVGRGALAGPLCVAAVALPDDPQIVGLDDSKKLSPKRREELSGRIDALALGKGVAFIEPEQIDACGMSASLRVAFSRALKACEEDMGRRADAVLVDGNPLHIHPKEISIVKGDGKVACIAAASIYAKVARDRLMVAASEEFPSYGFDSNKGYGSRGHIVAIKEQGPTRLHRRSFLNNILGEQQTLL